MNDHKILQLERELAYYKNQADRLSGSTLNNQYALVQLSNICKKNISGFKIIADLQRSFNFYSRKEDIYEQVMENIFSQLFLDRVILFEIQKNDESLKPFLYKGYGAEDLGKIEQSSLIVPAAFFSEKKPLLVSRDSITTDLENTIRETFLTKYFILLPLIKNQTVWGALFVGMQHEIKSLQYLSFSEQNIDMFESLAGIISAMTLQLEQKEIMEKERNRIARDMHDDIGAELSKISVNCSLLETKSGADQEMLKELKVIKDSAGSIVSNIGNIIWALNPDNNTIDNLLAYLREYTYDYLEMHGIIPVLDFRQTQVAEQISQEARTHIFMVLKEALHNIIKHAKADTVTLQIVSQSKIFICTITDNGIGFNSDNKNRFGNGLRNMRQRISETGGTLTINSSQGEGTTLVLQVPL